MSTPGDPANWATDLSRGIDPHSAAHSALGDDLERAATPAGRQPLEASCVRAAYEAIAAAGEEVSGPDGETLVSLRSGARAAAEAARVADEIGAGPGAALRAAARAWEPHVVAGQERFWHDGLRAFSQTCDAVERSDQWVIVEALTAARDAVTTDNSGSARAARAFVDEFIQRAREGESIARAWVVAADVTREQQPDTVFLVVVDAVKRVLAA